MSEPDWVRDRDHDPAAMLRAVEAQFPELAPVRMDYLSSGWEFDAYRVNERWAFRFPRRHDCAQSWEPPLLDRLSRELEVEVPVVEFLGVPGEHFPYPFFGHRWLDGVGPRSIEPDRATLAEQFGRLLSSLHPLEVDLPAAKWEPEQWITEVVELADWIRLPPRERERWADWLSGEVPVPEPYGGPARLCHNDLAEEHLLFDPASRRLTGVLDWTDASMGDPVWDFIGLYVWLGEEFVSRVLDHYQPDPGPGFLDRLRFAVRTRLLIWVGENRRRGEEDSLVPGTGEWIRQLAAACPR